MPEDVVESIIARMRYGDHRAGCAMCHLNPAPCAIAAALAQAVRDADAALLGGS